MKEQCNISGYIAKEDESAIFTTSEIWGYGVYSTKVKEENGKFYYVAL